MTLFCNLFIERPL